MNKVDVILDAVIDVITHVRGISDSLQKVADVLTEMKAAGTEPVAAIPEKTKDTPKKPKAKKYTLEDVRGVLAEKSQAGLTKEVKDLITNYGGTKLSDVDPEHYADIIKEAEELENE